MGRGKGGPLGHHSSNYTGCWKQCGWPCGLCLMCIMPCGDKCLCASVCVPWLLLGFPQGYGQRSDNKGEWLNGHQDGGFHILRMVGEKTMKTSPGGCTREVEFKKCG
mmetsp:Transcript_145580/g.279243  ORF Transcript_145580/g.279243 Transcript_145580/m.279243 type:complete len:107 (-) Transcript_145580:49-369(-)